MNYLMKVILVLLLILDLSSCVQKKIVVKDVSNNVDASFLGLDFNNFLEHITYDEIQEAEGCCWGIKRQGELLIILYDKRGLSDLKVRNFEILSPEIKFDDKICVGMTIENLLKIYPAIELLMDENNHNKEYFSPPSLMSYKPDGSLDTVVAFEVDSGTGEPLSSDKNYPTKLFSKEGYISKILVFEW